MQLHIFIVEMRMLSCDRSAMGGMIVQDQTLELQNLPYLETPRLILREPRVEDAAALSEYNSKEEFYRYLPIDPPTTASTKGYISYVISQASVKPRLNYYFIIEDRIGKKVIGDIYINIKDPEARIAVVGFGLDPDSWGKGYTTEALQRVLKFGFENIGMKRIYATCDPDNLPSAKVLQKSGMKYEGQHRSEEYVRGRHQDNCYYAMIDSDPR